MTASPGWAGIIPDSDAWERWRPAAEAEEITVDHSEWGVLLNKYLRVDAESGINRFDYAAVNTADKALLASYIESLSATSVAQLTRAQQQAYWINLYNALTIQLILDNPGVKSIRKIKDGFFSIGPWGIELIEVDGQVLTLNDIEHRILRPLYGDARVHFAVNCASLGCPNLQPEPWEADTLDAQYDRAAREFIAHPRGALVEADRITLSSIFKWFSEDFGDDRQAVLRWISQFADADKAERLRNYTGRVRYDYDWALNAP
ncbi:MAG: DUF547 domain-containing protein [Pseudomonadota bacterium]